MDIQLVINALEELSILLDGPSPARREQIDQIIVKLRTPSATAFQIRQLKRELSKDILFHPKCLGEVIVPNFTSYEWGDYLSSIADLCQQNL